MNPRDEKTRDFRSGRTSIGRQNKRSKANPGKDGKPRSTEPKGFKQRTTSLRQSRPGDQVVIGFDPSGPDDSNAVVIMDEDGVIHTAPPVKKLTAAGFKRATDLSAAAEPDPQVDQQPEGPLAPLDWKIQAMQLADGKCAVSGDQASHWLDPAFDVHHVIPKSWLRKNNLYAWVWDLRNALPLRDDIHDWFDDASDRCIPREVLPPSIWIFANDLDEHLRSSAATEYVLSHYPLVGAARLAELRSPTPEEFE